ncbi:aldose epimerase family protein [Ornithinibacillus scapharcae]|uniref:aldose epimerase family protein n=1 Tax=Ornithinibacillus scapharcae TaxID=1147159 RepID=UPI000225ADAF|nr:aldose epimerase family protein [Ornithinibacillus scapharcae]
MDIKIKQLQDNWRVYQLINQNGMMVEVLNFGGIITKVLTPDKNGQVQNVVLGYQNHLDYQSDKNFFGALIGQVAGRIQDASFQLNGKTYTVDKNEGNNHLHGGKHGLHKVIWDVEPFHNQHSVGVHLTYIIHEKGQGYPGNVSLHVTYALTNENQLSLEYKATTDKPTVLALTNHSYFNLSGNIRETIHNHQVSINSSKILELDKSLIPTGSLLDVTNTTFDFRSSRPLTDGISGDHIQHKIVGDGYDHYFIFDQQKEESVTVKEPTSGRMMTIETNQPGMVMYTANNELSNFKYKDGSSSKYLGVCFETQGTPASLHHDNLPSIILNKDETYYQKTVFTFSADS